LRQRIRELAYARPRFDGARRALEHGLVHDALADRRRFRDLIVVDQWSRQSPILEVVSSMSGLTVSAAIVG
jgi:putative transposase